LLLLGSSTILVFYFDGWFVLQLFPGHSCNAGLLIASSLEASCAFIKLWKLIFLLKFFYFKLIFLVFLDYFDVIIFKINLKNKKILFLYISK
jgi:hypothetical protein